MLGRTLLHYTVTEKIGEGGMGVVYKGRDTHLDRFVALKVLSHDRITDADRERRFIQEAKAASALNHPNIVTIHQIGTHDGVTFIAMELVAGRTLDEMIPRHGLPVARALNYAVQIADGLAAAHTAGIVHRDLKPGNIMAGDDGRVKILDFGLAKLMERGLMAGDGETRISDQTGRGLIVGTVAYMSPEQAEGRTLDTRSDIFSFGVVLYQMVTGRKPFDGETPLQTMSAILRETPPRLSEAAPGCPPELERIIDRCLRKDPERRWQHMQDVRIALLDLKEESDSGRLSAAPGGAPGARQRSWWPVATGAAALLVVAAAALTYMQTADPPAATTEIVPVPLTAYPGDERDPAFSPDGTQVAFSWAPDGGAANTYVKLIGPGDPIRLTNSPQDERMSQWSPDGRWIAFPRRLLSGSRLSDLVVIPALGGPERVLGRSPGSYLYWTPDSQHLTIVDGSPAALYLLPFQGGEKKHLVGPLEDRHSVRAGAVSPDGLKLAVIFGVGRASPLYVAPLSEAYALNGPLRALTPPSWAVSSLSWMPDSREIVFARTITGNNLGGTTAMYRVSVDGGEPRRLDFAGDNPWFLDVSRRGNRLAYTRLQRDVNLYRAELGSSSSLEAASVAFASSSRRDINGVFSPDGSRVAFTSDRSGANEIWLAGIDGRSLQQLTHSAPPGGSVDTDWPSWSPDGTSIVYSSQAPGVNTSDIFIIPVTGGTQRRLTDDAASDTTPSWSRDGRLIYFLSDRDGVFRVWKMPAEGGPAVRLSQSDAAILPPVDSPDGEWVYFQAGRILRVPAAGGDEQEIVTERFFGPLLPTSQGLYYMVGADDFLSTTLRLVPLDGGTPKVLGTIPYRTLGRISLSPDAKSVLYSRCDQCEADIMLVENFR